MACVRTSFPVKKFVTMHLWRGKNPRINYRLATCEQWMAGWAYYWNLMFVRTSVQSSAIFIIYFGVTHDTGFLPQAGFLFAVTFWWASLKVSMWTLKNPHSIPYQPELKTLKKEIHPSVHNHLLPVTHHFLNKWKVSLKTYEHLLYLRTNVCPFSSVLKLEKPVHLQIKKMYPA